jgi:replication-associated recombination protein RarA
MGREELLDKIEHLSDEHKNQVLQLVELLVHQEYTDEQIIVSQISKLSEPSFQEWDNEEDEIYDSL